MTTSSRWRLAAAGVCALALWGCQAGSPAAPSSVTGATGGIFRPFDDAPAPAPTPAPTDPVPAPTPAPTDPAPAPAPTPTDPAPAPGPAPVGPQTLTIQIVGYVGSSSFAPNPSTAAMGDMLVWSNMDAVTHHIVLDDGTDVGTIIPGASSAPIPLNVAATGYHCTLHPSMVGSINGQLAPDPGSAPPYGPPGPYDPGDPYYPGYRVRPSLN